MIGESQAAKAERVREDAGRRGGWGRIAAAVGCFGMAFAMVAGAIHVGLVAGLGSPLRLYAEWRSEKLWLMDQWRGRAESAAFGSSHMLNGFDPRVFDAEMKGTPWETKTLNLGIAGGSQSEQRAMAKAFVRQLEVRPNGQQEGPDRVKGGGGGCFVLLEATAGANFAGDRLVHPRTINIYDWSTVRFIADTTDRGEGWRRVMGRVGFALAGMAMHYTNVAMLSSSIFPAPLDREMIANQTKDDRRGLDVEPTSERLQAELRETFAGPRTMRPVPQSFSRANMELLDELHGMSPVQHLRVLYVVMPAAEDIASYPAYPAEIRGPEGEEPVLTLARPDLYPELYQIRYWHDRAHLNEEGAALGTRLLAEQMKGWYAKHPEASAGGCW